MNEIDTLPYSWTCTSAGNARRCSKVNLGGSKNLVHLAHRLLLHISSRRSAVEEEEEEEEEEEVKERLWGVL